MRSLARATDPPPGWPSQVYKCRHSPIQNQRSKCDPFPLRRLHRTPHSPERATRPTDASTQEPKKPDDYNVNSLLRTLRQKDSWRCTCKNTQPAPKMRAKSAIAGKSHDPKCMLQRTFFGERRWDGRNLGITLEQLQYLADRNLY